MTAVRAVVAPSAAALSLKLSAALQQQQYHHNHHHHQPLTKGSKCADHSLITLHLKPFFRSTLFIEETAVLILFLTGSFFIFSLSVAVQSTAGPCTMTHCWPYHSVIVPNSSSNNNSSTTMAKVGTVTPSGGRLQLWPALLPL